MQRGWSPLHYAARHGFLEVVQLLTDSGADPTLRAKDGRVPLCCAAGAGYFQVLSFLFKKDHDALSLMEDKSVIKYHLFKFHYIFSLSFCLISWSVQNRMIINRFKNLF